MNRSTQRVIVMAVSLVLGWGLATGCSGSGAYRPSLEANLLTYPEADLVSFTLSGTATCPTCTGQEPVIGLQVELLFQGDPLHTVALETFDGLGPFSIGNLRGPKGMKLDVTGRLYLDNVSESAALQATAVATIPNDDDDVVSVVLNFGNAK
jgi:hypothetical protein